MSAMNTEQKIIKNKVGLLKLSEMLGSVSEACKVMGAGCSFPPQACALSKDRPMST
jgi:hypothetical protein